MLRAENICKSYRRRKILDGVSLEAAPGDCIGIVGSNGCGKTTLLSILAGARKAGRGRLDVDGTELFSHRRQFCKKIAYVPQENPLIPELSVKDNLALWYQGNRKQMKEDLERGPAAMLGIKPVYSVPVRHLSGGMKKRLSLACALSGHAPYLIMDEPGAALDLECKEAIRHYLMGYLAEGNTVILTSHELEELSLCSRLLVLREGRLYEAGTRQTAQSMIALFHGEKENVGKQEEK